MENASRCLASRAVSENGLQELLISDSPQYKRASQDDFRASFSGPLGPESIKTQNRSMDAGVMSIIFFTRELYVAHTYHLKAPSSGH